MVGGKTWDGPDRREYCQLCRSSTENGIKSACSKARNSMLISICLLGICFVLSGIAWSAKSDVSHQKETILEVKNTQKQMATDISKIAEFIDLLKDGKIHIMGGSVENHDN